MISLTLIGQGRMPELIPAVLQKGIEHMAETIFADEPKLSIFIFGSRVTANHSDRSDYDIGILAARPIALHTMQEAKAQLNDLPLLQEIDLVDFNSISSSFRNMAESNAQVIYER